MTTEGLMLPCMVDAMEGRDVATSEIPGAFLQKYYNKGDIHIKMEGETVTIIKDIKLDY